MGFGSLSKYLLDWLQQQNLPKGLDNIRHIFKDSVDNYVDDCIAFSNNATTQLRDIQKVLGQLQATGLTLHGSKYFFRKTTTTHLWYEYSVNGVAPSPEKTKSISTWTTPKTTKELLILSWLVNFYHHFMPYFADMAAPLTELTSKSIQFKWEPKYQQAFDTLKHALVSPPILPWRHLCAHYGCLRHWSWCHN